MDVTNFYTVNVTDTCAVWNALSSVTLYQAAKQAKIVFCITTFIQYECLIKKRSNEEQRDRDLKARLRSYAKGGDFTIHEVQVEDLLAPVVVQNAGHIGKGELSAIAFAYRSRQAFLTDDKQARRLATNTAISITTQTTPHLLGWLFYSRRLVDGDFKTIIGEHSAMGRPLEPYFSEAYEMAMRARCLEFRDSTQT